VLEQAEDKLLIGFIDSIFRIVNVSIGLLVFLFTIGQDEIASNVLGAATISSVVIGFAFKDIAENFLAGIIMAFNRPFSIGDTIMTGAVEGTITEMSLRDTHIKTFDGKDVYVPNSQIIKTPLYNYTTDGHLRKSFDIGLEYGTDIEATRSIILDAVNTTPGILQEEKSATTLIKNLGASTINIQVQYWVNTFNKQYTTEEINSQAIKKTLNALESAQINLPK
jgi:small-conductance mechanosensitive channel